MVKSEIDRKLRFRKFESVQSNTDTFVKLLRSSTSGSSSEGGFQNDSQIPLIEPHILWLIDYESSFFHHFETHFKLKSRSLYGRTSLHFAAYHGRSEIIHQLLGAGLDSSIQDAFGKTAVHYARENEHFEAARWCWLGRWQYGSQGGIQKAKDENGNPGPKLLQSLHSKKKPSASANTARSKSSEKVQKWLRRVSKWFSHFT